MEHGLRLLGVPARIIAGTAFELPPGQATYLAAVLALRGVWVAREELVLLIWPEHDEQRGRHNLAQLLYAMRRADWGQGLETETRRVRWSLPTDVALFRSAVADADWSTATARYAGDLLEAVAEPTSPYLAEWLRHERHELCETWRMAQLERAEELMQANDWFACAQLLRRLLASDALLEEAVHALMRAEALGGRRDAALRVYDDFRRRLRDELGLEPLDTTAELAAAVRSGSLSLVAEPEPARSGIDQTAAIGAGQPDVRPGPVRGLGDDAGPFVGRALELSEFHALMRSRGNRLITVHGPGGIGKTRIARQLARERAGHFADGAAWVRMAAASNEADAVEAIAATLGLRIDGDSAALAAALSDRELLLVLDQVEHLDTIGGLVQELLDGSASMSLVATSRSPLHLPDETLMGLRGLAIPPNDDSEDAEAYDAIGFLLRAGRRSRADLHPRGAERTALVALARLLEGSPLALVLAAGWLRFLEPSEILQEVRRDLDVLRSQAPDVDRGHASLGAVFESSWTLLSEVERESLRRLAVFRGGCTKESAVAVADVPLATLLALTNRSLLYREDKARFASHSVVQFFAEQKLAARPELAGELEARHRAYFQALAEDADRQLDTPEQAQAFARLEAASPNLTAALARVVAAGDRQAALELVAALGRFWLWRGRNKEGLAWIQRLPASAGQAQSSEAAIRVRLAEGLMLERTGSYAAAAEAFKDALEEAEALGDAALMATARRDMAIVAWRRGDLGEAKEQLVSACDSYRHLDREADLAGALANLGNVARDAGDLSTAHVYFDEALSLVERIGHVWEIANTLNNKAITYSYAGDRAAAVETYERALELQRSMGNEPGMALTLINLGVEYMDSGELELAEQHYVEALKLCEEIGNADGVGHLNINLGILAQWNGDFDEAHEHFAVALKLRRQLGAKSLVAQSVLAFFDLAVARGLYERALVLEGAGVMLLEAAGSPLPAPHQVVHDEALAKASSSVPRARAAELQRRGAALATAASEEVVDFALGTRALP